MLAALLVAVITSIRLIGHVRPEIPRRSLAYRGILFYRRDTFDEEAGPLHRRFTRSAGLFFALLIVAMVVISVAAERCG